MTTEELHEIYRWAWNMALRAVELAGGGDIGDTAHMIAEARIAWVNAKVSETAA